MSHNHTPAPSLRLLTDEQRRNRRWEYRAILDVREPLAGPKRNEVLATAIDAMGIIDDVLAFVAELRRDDSAVSAVAHAFAEEIERALRGQR